MMFLRSIAHFQFSMLEAELLGVVGVIIDEPKAVS